MNLEEELDNNELNNNELNNNENYLSELKPIEKFIPPSQRSDAPLIGVINPELEDIDPR